jgi:S1-C subfamily serine protease
MKVEDCSKETKAYFTDHGWAGIEKDKNDDGTWTVTKVHAGSPGEKAGFQVGDKIVAINGVTLASATDEQRKTMKQGMKIGSTVTYDVDRGGQTTTLTATLGKIPEDVLTAMIEKHKKEEHTVAQK